MGYGSLILRDEEGMEGTEGVTGVAVDFDEAEADDAVEQGFAEGLHIPCPGEGIGLIHALLGEDMRHMHDAGVSSVHRSKISNINKKYISRSESASTGH